MIHHSRFWSMFVLILMAATGLVRAAANQPEDSSADEPAVQSAGQPGDQPRSVVVNVVAKTTMANGTIGGSCKPVRVTAGRSEDGKARVGFFESQVGATGSQWRSAGWMSAVTTAMLTDFDPRTTRVSIEYQGAIDGPSAGAILTVGLLAAVRGDTVRPDAAMTGTINPDGSIGPVGGISHKIDGAAAVGMKLLLVPAGKRFDIDENSNERVDLVEYGQQKGVEVRNVFDVFEAYKLLTGVDLPRAPRAGTPRVSPAVQERVREMIVAWMDRYQHTFKAYEALSGEAKYSEEVEAMYTAGVESLKQAKVLMNEGDFTAAMWDCVVGSGYSYLAMETARCRYTYANLGYAGVIKRLRDNGWLAEDVTKMARRLRRETPRTLDQLSIYLVACDAFLEAVSLQAMARIVLANMPDQESELALEMAADAAENQILAWVDLKLVGDYLDLQDAYQGKPIPRAAPWRETSEYLYNASKANMAVFDSLIVEPVAKARSVAADDVRNLLMRRDKAYGIVRVANEGVFPNLNKLFGEGDALGYAYLATSMYTHTRTAGLVAKYYSLSAELDEYSQVVSIPHERILAEWLSFADDQSRRSIGQLQESGVDATASAQLYAVASIKSRRDLSQKLEGLYEFWAADMHARMLRLLSRFDQRQESSGVNDAPSDEDAASATESK